MMTAINSEETIKGIKLMSDLFTLYNLPQRVGSFYNDLDTDYYQLELLIYQFVITIKCGSRT